eukprot:1995911-Pleurochrysis_carterae.AAC.1
MALTEARRESHSDGHRSRCVWPSPFVCDAALPFSACRQVRVIRMPRHGASCPVGIGVSCSADRRA